MKKIAIVTGASNGIGKAVAKDLANQHYHVILIARSEDKLKAVQNDIIANQGEASYYVLNVADGTAVKNVIADIAKKFGRIDVLFNNAGIYRLGTSDLSFEEMNEVIQINLLGAMYVANAVAAYMKSQKSGYILNVSSLAGKRGVPTSGVYCASKFGLVGYNEALFKELLPYGVIVTAICPSTVATDMTKTMALNQSLMITVDDIVKTVNYLLGLSATAAVPEVLISCPALEMKIAGSLKGSLLGEE